MSTVAAGQHGGASLDLGATLKGAVMRCLTMAVAVFGLGAVLYYAWNWGLAPNFKSVNEMADFWAGPLMVLGLYAVALALKAAWVSRTVELSVNAVLGFVVDIGVVLLLAWVVHEFLA